MIILRIWAFVCGISQIYFIHPEMIISWFKQYRHADHEDITINILFTYNLFSLIYELNIIFVINKVELTYNFENLSSWSSNCWNTQTINVYIGLRMLLAINPCGMETKISALDCLINCIFFHTLSKSYETYL